jgi:hypothetical protein
MVHGYRQTNHHSPVLYWSMDKDRLMTVHRLVMYWSTNTETPITVVLYWSIDTDRQTNHNSPVLFWSMDSDRLSSSVLCWDAVCDNWLLSVSSYKTFIYCLVSLCVCRVIIIILTCYALHSVMLQMFNFISVRSSIIIIIIISSWF